MRNKKYIYLMSGIFGFSFILLALSFNSAQLASEQQNDLVIKINTPKQNYAKGEVVPLNIEVANTSSSDISLKGASVESGYVKLFVSPSVSEFKQYINGGVRKKTKNIVIPSGEAIRSQATILWNFVPETKSLSSMAVKAYSDNQLMTNYAFPNDSIYFIKAVLVIPGEKMTKIESEPIKIVVNEPVGEDLQVWNQIKEDGDFAYFIQENEIRIPEYKTKERGKFQQKVEQIINQYPNSFYAESLRQSLEKYQAAEAKRREAMQKLRQTQPQ